MRRPILPAVALALVLAVPASAAEKVTDRDRFALWNGCQPVRLLVEDLPERAKAIGLSTSRIETAVRSRLRGARMYSDERLWPYLYVNVNVVGAAFGYKLELNKWVKDEASGEEDMAETWGRGGVGTHGKNPSYVLSAIGELTDLFIDEYLRVNADACGKSLPSLHRRPRPRRDAEPG